jgi:hypothetical protein
MSRSLINNPVVVILIVIAIGLALAVIPFMASVRTAIQDAMVAVASIIVIIALVWAFQQVGSK